LQYYRYIYRSSHAKYQAQANKLQHKQRSIERELRKQENCRDALEKKFAHEVKLAKQLSQDISEKFSPEIEKHMFESTL